MICTLKNPLTSLSNSCYSVFYFVKNDIPDTLIIFNYSIENTLCRQFSGYVKNGYVAVLIS